jgi:phosphate starvation-inducible PhoH-like protein
MKKIAEHDIVVGIGPAGTGKTYLAVAMAVDALVRKRVRRIVLARPAVEAGESLGFLPATCRRRSTRTSAAVRRARRDDVGRADGQGARDADDRDRPARLHARPHAGDAFVILDEAQNATNLQMKMFLTRLA